MSKSDFGITSDEGCRSDTTFTEDDSSSALSDLTIDCETEGRSNLSAQRGDSKKTFSETILVTKPEHVETKCGFSGQKVQLKANMFQVEELADFEFNQYRVDFVPDLDMENIRKAFIGQHMKDYGK